MDRILVCRGGCCCCCGGGCATVPGLDREDYGLGLWTRFISGTAFVYPGSLAGVVEYKILLVAQVSIS